MAEIRDLRFLEPEFHEKLVKLLSDLEVAGFEFRVSTSMRTPWQQARIWRQSRATEEIQEELFHLRSANAKYLADIIADVGPQSGPPRTNSIPGLSWHAWGQAADCFLVENGRALWVADHPGFIAYAATAKASGLTAGRYFHTSDPPHVQMNPKEPHQIQTLAAISVEMESRFGRDEAAWLRLVNG